MKTTALIVFAVNQLRKTPLGSNIFERPCQEIREGIYSLAHVATLCMPSGSFQVFNAILAVPFLLKFLYQIQCIIYRVYYTIVVTVCEFIERAPLFKEKFQPWCTAPFRTC